MLAALLIYAISALVLVAVALIDRRCTTRRLNRIGRLRQEDLTRVREQLAAEAQAFLRDREATR